jgi:hypothetical protein
MHTQIFRKTVLGLMALGLTWSTLALLSCGGDDDDGAGITQRQAVLQGAAERPTPVTTNATGSSLLTISDDRSQIFYTLTYTGLANVTQAHIHVGSADVAGPIILYLCTNVGTGTNVACNGGPLPTPQSCPQGATVTITGTLTAADLSCKAATATTPAVNSFADAVTQLIDGNTYTNVHTQANPGGEIRGQDVP